MKQRLFISVLMIFTLLFQTTEVAQAVGPVIFPKGPYTSELLSIDVLKSESANFSALVLPDGTIRGYAPSIVERSFVVFESKDDGKSFSRVGLVDFGDPNSDNFIGQPRVIKLNDGKYHLYSSGPEGISCFSSTDGFKFSIDKLRCVPNSIIPTPPYYKDWRLSGAAVAILPDGSYRMYFSDAGVQNDNRFPPHQIYSAKSPDGVNWTIEPGARIGFSTKTIKGNAIHPDVIQHADGSVTLFYRSYIPQNINYAFSKDGLNFSDEYISWFSKKDPIVGYGNEGGDPSLILDRNGNIIMFQGTWIGPDKLGTSAIRLVVGKGTKFGEEIGRDLGWQGFIQNREMNCVSKSSPKDPDYGRVWVLASSETDIQCPDNYSIDASNSIRNTMGPKYSLSTKCIWMGNGTPPRNLKEVFYSGVTTCPEGFSVGNASSKPGNDSSVDGAKKGINCYAKTRMIVKSPIFTLIDKSSSCPSGYSTKVNKAKQTIINCKALPNAKVEEAMITLYGIGIKPTCPKGYVKK